MFLLPAFLSQGTEYFRIVPVLPVILVVVAVGLNVLGTGLPPGKKNLFLCSFLAISPALDFYHLAVTYPRACLSGFGHWNDYTKSVERWRAYHILKTVAGEKGPGVYLSNFDPYPFDRSLELASGDFNLEEGWTASLNPPKWTAFLANVNDKPFLSQRFPLAKIIWLDPDLEEGDEGLILVVIPRGGIDLRTFNQWALADRALVSVSMEMLNRPTNGRRGKILQEFSKIYHFFQGDPFLESLFWNQVYLNHSADGDLPSALFDLRQAIRLGYPSAYFYNEAGALLFSEKNQEWAREAFTRACKSEFNKTPAVDNLREMDKQEKNNRP